MSEPTRIEERLRGLLHEAERERDEAIRVLPALEAVAAAAEHFFDSFSSTVWDTHRTADALEAALDRLHDLAAAPSQDSEQ